MQGHIRKRVHTTKDGRTTTNWYVVVELPRSEEGKRRQKWHGGFATRREAEATRARLIHELNTGSYIEPHAVTLSKWVSDWWLPTTKTRVKPSTLDSYRRNLELHALPHLGNRQLRYITPAMLNVLYSRLLASGNKVRKGGLSPKTVRYIHTILHKALADAVDAGMIGVNAAERAKPPRPRATAAREILFWEPEELRRFLRLIHGHRLEAAWRLSAMTGMRRGEVLGLRWADLDLDAARISVRRALVSVGYQIITSTPKNHLARVIDLDATTVQCLRRHRKQQDGDRAEWGNEYQDEDLVFCKENGTPVHPHTFSQAFQRLIAKSDLRRIRLHDLRHTHATIALKAGIQIKVISERLGHETPAFTLKQYAHVIPGMQAEAAAAVAALVREAT